MQHRVVQFCFVLFHIKALYLTSKCSEEYFQISKKLSQRISACVSTTRRFLLQSIIFVALYLTTN